MSSQNRTISALIVDDEPLGRDLVRHMLGAHPDVEIVGECGDGAKAVAAIKRLAPALGFLDIRMPKLHEIDVLEAAGNYVSLHVAGKTHLIHETMTNTEAKLDPARFVRIHRCTIVNVARIAELRPHFNGEYIILLKDETELKLSRGYVDKARAALGLP
jgi:two-component system LytT family response regulator